MDGTRLVVVEDNLLVREGLLRLLSAADDVEVVAAAASLPEARSAIDSALPDVVLTDIRMPPNHADEGIQLAAELRDQHPDMGVLVLSQFVEPAYALALLGDGVRGRGYLLKDHIDDGTRLTDAIEAVAGHGSYLDDDVVEALVRARTQAVDSPLMTLTPREREVLAELATGATNAVIAERLIVSPNAIEKHSNAIFAKLGLTASGAVNRRVAAVLMFLSGERIEG